MPPAQQRPDAHQNQQQQEERAVDLVEEGRRHADAVAGQDLAEHGEEGAPQRRKGDAGKEPVVGQEGGLTARIRIDRLFAAQQRQAIEEQPQKAKDDDDQEAQEIRARHRCGQTSARFPARRCAW